MGSSGGRAQGAVPRVARPEQPPWDRLVGCGTQLAPRRLPRILPCLKRYEDGRSRVAPAENRSC